MSVRSRPSTAPATHNRHISHHHQQHQQQTPSTASAAATATSELRRTMTSGSHSVVNQENANKTSTRHVEAWGVPVLRTESAFTSASSMVMTKRGVSSAPAAPMTSSLAAKLHQELGVVCYQHHIATDESVDVAAQQELSLAQCPPTGPDPRRVKVSIRFIFCLI